uniref:Uncharacterized protein n=1 Tax=Arion vulgaris TaxID=1028688 RepID=A0A0B7BUU8_9EUPU
MPSTLLSKVCKKEFGAHVIHQSAMIIVQSMNLFRPREWPKSSFKIQHGRTAFDLPSKIIVFLSVNPVIHSLSSESNSNMVKLKCLLEQTAIM